MLKTILSVSGKSGLYKMISQGKNLLIIESLVDKKRIPSYESDKTTILAYVDIYTNEDRVPLYKVLNSIKEKENLEKIQWDIAKATPDELRVYMGEVLPDFDRERVYPTDIRRLLNWYNILVGAGFQSFDPEEAEEQNEESESEGNDEAKKTKEEVKKEAKPQKTTSTSKMAGSQKASTLTKQPATGKMRQRTKQK